MKDIFTEDELKSANEIVTLGLTDAAKSLAYFTKTDTKLELVEV